MLEIQQIQISRLRDIKELQVIDLSHVSNFNSAEVEQLHQKLSKLKRYEKIRSNRELDVLKSLNSTTFQTRHQIEQFFFMSLKVLSEFDQSYLKYEDKGELFSVKMEENLKKVFEAFFQKHSETEKRDLHTSDSLTQEISNLSPSFFLGWIRKWSKTVFTDCLQKLSKKTSQIIESIPSPSIKAKKSLGTFPQIDQNVKKASQRDCSSIAFQPLIEKKDTVIKINCKENVYSFCLDEIKNYYKLLGMQDLDMGYMKNIKRAGDKANLLSVGSLAQVANILLQSKNKEIKRMAVQYEKEFAEWIIRHPQLKQSIKKSSPLKGTKVDKRIAQSKFGLKESTSEPKKQEELLNKSKIALRVHPDIERSINILKRSSHLLKNSNERSKRRHLSKGQAFSYRLDSSCDTTAKFEKLKRANTQTEEEQTLELPKIHASRNLNEINKSVNFEPKNIAVISKNRKRNKKIKSELFQDCQFDQGSLPKEFSERKVKLNKPKLKITGLTRDFNDLVCKSIDSEIRKKSEIYAIDRGISYGKRSQDELYSAEKAFIRQSSTIDIPRQNVQTFSKFQKSSKKCIKKLWFHEISKEKLQPINRIKYKEGKPSKCTLKTIGEDYLRTVEQESRENKRLDLKKPVFTKPHFSNSIASKLKKLSK